MSHTLRRFMFVNATILSGSLGVQSAHAIYWNNDPAFGTSSSGGLTDKTIWFNPNDQVIYNDSNSTRGTAVLLNNEWALSVRHVVQNGGDYGSLANPNLISVNVAGVGGYFVDQIFTPDGGSEISLLHLRGGVNGALNLVPNINSSTDENGRIVEIGGYGLWGQINTTGSGGTNAGTSNTSTVFHRAYNTIQGFNGNGQIQITQNADSQMTSNGLLEGIAGSGDSGGPMFGFYGSNFATQQNDRTQWKLVGLTATSGGPTQGQSSQYTRVSSYSGFIASRMNSYPTAGAAKTGAWVQDSGNNLYDAGTNKISVTSSTSAPPVVHAKFGAGNAGYTLAQVGDKIAMTATLDTPFTMDSRQFRFGMFDDVGGTIAGNINGGTSWNGYLAVQSSEGNAEGLYKKGTNGGTGAYWSVFGSGNTGTRLGTAGATGTYDNGSGTNDFAPAGSYSLSMTYTRVAGGLQIDWTMTQLSDALYALDNATGLWSHNNVAGSYTLSGSIIDPNAASWTYDQLGFFLYGSTIADRTISLSDINVGFTAVPEPAALAAIGVVGALLRRRRMR